MSHQYLEFFSRSAKCFWSPCPAAINLTSKQLNQQRHQQPTTTAITLHTRVNNNGSIQTLWADWRWIIRSCDEGYSYGRWRGGECRGVCCWAGVMYCLLSWCLLYCSDFVILVVLDSLSFRLWGRIHSWKCNIQHFPPIHCSPFLEYSPHHYSLLPSVCFSQVAIKHIKRKFKTWSGAVNLREVQSLRQISHANIVSFKEVIRERWVDQV